MVRPSSIWLYRDTKHGGRRKEFRCLLDSVVGQIGRCQTGMVLGCYHVVCFHSLRTRIRLSELPPPGPWGGGANLSEASKATVVALLAQLNDKDAGARSAAACAVGGQADLSEATVAALSALLKDEDAGIRVRATRAIASQANLSDKVLKSVGLSQADTASSIDAKPQSVAFLYGICYGAVLTTQLLSILKATSHASSTNKVGFGRLPLIMVRATNFWTQLRKFADYGIVLTTSCGTELRETTSRNDVQRIMLPPSMLPANIHLPFFR
ncbi:hypothetical protein Purlil1_12977 [Purpureocillium lilacinum]|uniref:Uncharacterized protein n=1 Tax=Purpureocillium lilacinum TaxID=33203 RepID=A0ABR0BFK6_PURLI|nr:hypothetical protein Purlil1_12977 [Purpureocillium lilacinum]